MRTLRVSTRDLLFAMENRVPGTTQYLNTETGEVVPAFGFNRDQILAEIRQYPKRYLRLAPQAGRSGYTAMVEFARTVSRPELRAVLEAAISGPGVYRRFRTALREEPREFKRWQQFRGEKVAGHLRKRLEADGIAIELVPDND
ncbi:hypothetical protein FJY68_04295 [candidate division WOR-3 bacterium]|uniref:Uncharacterized protein n=1 Tax=candidate division WOR-3 bacterium TaxID=2052148 RepID=A0A937XDJ5_UNCW3|nr:hypothetical protein [candidate division WOR-3 bacterium]